MKKIAVFTSGGDAPGMNACIRAVVRGALFYKMEVMGIIRGYEGMINGHFIPLNGQSVSNIIQKGGTILKSARCEEFKTPEGRAKAAAQLKKHGIEGLVAIGGNGTFTGAKLLCDEHGINVIGCPGTIDNDLYGTDFTIGYDTAVNTALEAIDKIRDTADAHDRIFFIEVMGRDTGYIAMRTAISAGAEMVVMPEIKVNIKDIIKKLGETAVHTKSSHLIVVAEGDKDRSAQAIAEKVKKALPSLDCRVSTLGHIQRGGSPTASDRILASRLGLGAVEGLLAGKTNVMVGVINRSLVYTPFSECITKKKPINKELIRLVEILNGRHYK
jgi:6-phosphofructokinase 1